MTVELKGEPDRDGNGRRVALIGTAAAAAAVTPPAAPPVTPPVASRAAAPAASAPEADLAALCRSIAELARTTARPPSRIRLEHLGTAVEVEWAEPVVQAPAGPVAPATAGSAASAGEDGQAAEDAGRHTVRAPMIGTFYRAPEPGAPPFVEVGDTVVPGQPIGILEVMKMMSPVESDVAGTVVEILAADAGPVEFQQPLIAVEPATGG